MFCWIGYPNFRTVFSSLHSQTCGYRLDWLLQFLIVASPLFVLTYLELYYCLYTQRGCNNLKNYNKWIFSMPYFIVFTHNFKPTQAIKYILQIFPYILFYKRNYIKILLNGTFDSIYLLRDKVYSLFNLFSI
jgi:hypothetical protein